MVFGKLGAAMKDGALGIGLRKFFNEKFGEYGDVQDCVVDTKAGRVTAQVIMRGERDPITITINRYEMVNEDGKTFFTVRQVTTSRAWITLLLNKVLDGRRFEVPASVGRIL